LWLSAQWTQSLAFCQRAENWGQKLVQDFDRNNYRHSYLGVEITNGERRAVAVDTHLDGIIQILFEWWGCESEERLSAGEKRA
jgi:hypothetical protein